MTSIEGQILLIASLKGGGGKSLLAANLAVALSRQGHKVLLVDGDKGTAKVPEAAASLFSLKRAATFGAPNLGYTCVQLHGLAIANQAPQLRKTYSHIIIDCGGSDNPSVRAGLTVADSLLIPVPPRSVDEWQTAATIDRVQEARPINRNLRAYLAISRGDIHGSDNENTKADIRADYLTPPADDAERSEWVDPQVTIIDTVICERKPFANAFGEGRSILELEAHPTSKRDASIRNAKAELAGLQRELFEYQEDTGVIYNVNTA